MSKALYRKYRSRSLDDVIGQDHITGILKNALESGRIAHAYLFTGPRGVGKTSVARILAHEINKLPYDEENGHLDIIEIDAASNNGVEDVRELREKVQLAPISASKKVYIIDEVHMLSKPAFNALLKTLEEPPEHIVFILATTAADKLPATIISRTQQYGFRPISTDDLISRLKFISKKEKIKISDDALQIIAERGDSSFRDAISLLDQLSSLFSDGEKVTAEIIEKSLGLAPKKTIVNIIKSIETKDFAALVDQLQQVSATGASATVLAKQMSQYIKSNIIKLPHLLPVLDGLIEVTKSAHPDIKMLSVLGSFAQDDTQTQVATSKPKVVESPKSAALIAPVKEFTASVEELKAEPQTVSKTPKSSLKKFDGSLDWSALVEYAKENYVALYSVISKCGHEIEGSTLKLYTGGKFYKKKIDDPRYSAHLYECLDATGGTGLEVETIPSDPPIKDSQAAIVADIMGGGVVVKVADGL